MLEQEITTYRVLLPHLLANEGKYVLIHHEQLLGVFDTREQAVHAGWERVGPTLAFLVDQIREPG